MRIRWSERALFDLDAAYEYLDQQNPEAAIDFFTAIFSAVERLEQFSELGPIAQDLSDQGPYRQLVRKEHRIIYRIQLDTVFVLRVWDARRNPMNLDLKETG